MGRVFERQLRETIRLEESSGVVAANILHKGGVAVGCLQTPNLADCRPKSSKVSGRSLKYSRFPTTTAGIPVRSVLRGGVAVNLRFRTARCRCGVRRNRSTK